MRLVKSDATRRRAQIFYDESIRPFVVPFTERTAQQLAALIANTRRAGRQLNPYDAAIAAAAVEWDVPLVFVDGDFDGISGLKAERI